MVNFTAYQDVECVYIISGQYGRAPRILYYFLILFVILLRRQDWLAAGAAAACLTYGGSAAIHAFILAPILSMGSIIVADSAVELPNSTVVSVKALVADLDSDATLAIVGTGFLIAMPMAIWSVHFRHSAAVSILVMWIILMFIGMICCMTNLYAVNGSSTGPLRQFRFCNLGYNDTLPLSGNSVSVLNDSWNDTIWSYFRNRDPTLPSCLYPCLNANELLRQTTDIHIIEFLDIDPPSTLYWGLEIASAITYGCVPLGILFCIILLLLRLNGYKSTEWEYNTTGTLDWKARSPHYMLWAIDVYGKILTPFVFVAFLVWVEWIIIYDLQSEPSRAMGAFSRRGTGFHCSCCWAVLVPANEVVERFPLPSDGSEKS